LVDVVQFLLQGFVVTLADPVAFLFLVHIVNYLDVCESCLVEIDGAHHGLVGPEIFFAELHQDLFVSLVVADVALKVEDSRREVAEKTIAKSSEFFYVVRQLIVETLLLGPDVSEELNVFLIVLRHVDLADLYVFLVVNDEILVRVLKGLKVFDDVLEVEKGHLNDLSVLV
jgi:hypothetical protein